MKNKAILILLFIISVCNAQSSDTLLFSVTNFEQEVLLYRPIQRVNVSDQSYSKGLMIFESTVESIREKENTFNVTHYWNIAVAFALFEKPEEHISLVFQRGIQINELLMCEYSSTATSINNLFERQMPNLYRKLKESCDNKIEEGNSKVAENLIISDEQGALVNLMLQIRSDDQKFRNTVETFKANLEEQTQLDSKNQHLVDSLLLKHNKYIGKSMVGEKLSHVMWLVVQHSDVETMKRYLPLIHQAFKDGQLKSGPLKMLIDRVFSRDKGYQIFGSQGPGIKRANDSIREVVKKKYHLN